MIRRIGRRSFLSECGLATLSAALFPVSRRFESQQSSADRPDAAWNALVSDAERQLPKMMNDLLVPGLSIVAIRGGEVAWRRGFGVKDAQSKAPVDTDTMFEAASMSKSVFAYAVMKLCEKGVMNLDTPLTKYTSQRLIADPRLDLITARRVLCHTTGFQNWSSSKDPLSIHFTPGEKFRYSGEGYSYLELVVCQLTSEPFEPFMQSNLLVPFGMKSSGYVWNDVFATRMARPHDAKGMALENKKSTAADVARYGSAGALLSTPTDYAKFVIEVIDPKPSDAFRLNPASLNEMLRPQVKIADQYSTSWALGWEIQHTDKGDVITHGGDNTGFHCRCVASVPRKSGFVVMTNGENGGELVKTLLLGDLMNRFL